MTMTARVKGIHARMTDGLAKNGAIGLGILMSATDPHQNHWMTLMLWPHNSGIICMEWQPNNIAKIDVSGL